MSDINSADNLSFMGFLKNMSQELGLQQVGISPISNPHSIKFYEDWLKKNYHGDMEYLRTHLDHKKNPRSMYPQFNSIISFTQNYFPSVQPPPVQIPARIALYAQNEDYHYWLKNKLNLVIERLRILFPNETFLPFVDSGPILEREAAYQSQLGWIGKNTCLIHPKIGSLFFIAEILTSINIPTTEENFEPMPDFCGTCTACIDVCPTKAIESPKTLNATKCISYLTIESKSVPQPLFRSQIGDWFFGCDLCQTVCPWNQKVFRQKKLSPSQLTSTQSQLVLSDDQKKSLIDYFRFLLTASNKAIQKHHFGSPVSRAGAKGLKRNALIVIGNKKLTELKPEVQGIKESSLLELRDWTLTELE